MAGTEKSLRGQVFDKIRSDILNGKYKRGEELVESSIGKELGISRTPVREAIRQLELEGLVQLVPNKGAFVTGISEKESQAIADLRAAWNNMKKTERQGLLTESKTEIPTTGGFAVPFKEKINLEDYEKFDFAADCRNYANTTGGVSINIQMNKAGGGYYEVKYKWFNAKKEESVITVQTDALVGNAEKTVCSSVKFQGAQKYSLPITLNEVYGYKRVSPAVPGNADEMNLKSWIAASKALDTADYSNTDEFSAAVTAAEKTLSELEDIWDEYEVYEKYIK